MSMEQTLPRDYYLSETRFTEEKERIFCAQWVCVGREEEIPGAGDYLLLDVVGESILLVRSREGTLYAHYNVCRHRGSQLVLGVEPKPAAGPAVQPTGTFASGIRCPYHAWTYNLDGRLRTAPFLEEGNGFRKDALSLFDVGVEVWGGFVFVHLGDGATGRHGDVSTSGVTLSSQGDGGTAPRGDLVAPSPRRPVADQLGGAPERVARYPLGELRIGRRIVYRVAANWKVIVENYNECYHCANVHPELCRLVPAFKQKGGMDLDWDRGVPHRDGAWTFTMSGTTSRRPFPGLNEDERTRHKGELIYPNFMCSLSAEHVAAFTLWPYGPSETTVVCDFLFHPVEMAKPEFDPMDAVEFWDLTNRQDWAICESVQRGMRSRVFTHGYYAPMENLSLDIRRYIGERLGE